MPAPSRRAVLKWGAGCALGSAFTSDRFLTQLAAAEPATKAKQTKDPYADAVLVDGEVAAPARDSFTVVVLPDTQFYSEKHPDTYYAQTEWIADEAKRRRIAAVLHLGDITNKNSSEQWQVASKAMARLDGTVPYFLVCGNHDYSEGGKCVDRTTQYNDYFPAARFKERANFGGTYDREPQRMENSYQTFAAGGRKFLVVSLEFGPRRDVVRWANEVVARHADHETILLTHAYMYFDDSRYDWTRFGKQQKWNPHSYPVAKAADGDVCDGQELWSNFVSRNENFLMTLNGHVIGDGLGRMTSQTPGGRNVSQMLVNFQMRPNGGDGWLRVMEFKADGTIDVCDYSPTRNQRNESPQNMFRIARRV